MNNFSISKALGEGWRKTWKHFWTFLGFFLILIGATMAISFLSALLFRMPIISGLIVFSLQILTVFVNLVLLLAFLRIARGENLVFDSLIDGFGDLFSTKGGSASGGKNISFVANFALTGAIYGMIVVLGFFAFIIPGIYLTIKYSQVLFFVADNKKTLPDCKNMKLSEALRKIFQEYRQTFHDAGDLMSGAKWRYIVFNAVIFAIALLSVVPGILTLGLGFVFLNIMLGIAFASVYLQLSEKQVAS